MTFEYSVTFDATPGECVDYTNTAWVEVLGDDDPTAEFEIYVCDRSDLTLIKTVDASYDRDYDWDVEKTADQTRFDVAGDSTVTADYEVVATASDPIDTNKALTGTVRITNPNTEAAPIQATVDGEISIAGAVCSFDDEASLDEDTTADGLQITLDNEDIVELDYTCTIPSGTDVEGTYENTMTMSWGEEELVYTEDFTFTANSVTNDTVDVTDTMTGRTPEVKDLGTATVAESPKTFTYSEELAAVAGQCITYDNTGTVVQTESEDTESVVACAGADLEVSKNVIHSFDRTYLWDIEKDADATEILADPDTGLASVTYTIVATPRSAPDGWTDSGWQMSGEITVTNPNEWMDVTATVTDTVDIGGGATCTVAGGSKCRRSAVR